MGWHEVTKNPWSRAGDTCHKPLPFWGDGDRGGRSYDGAVATVEQPTLVTLTESAAAKIKELMA